MLRQFRLTSTPVLRIVAAIAACAMLGAIFWQAETISRAARMQPYKLVLDSQSEGGPASSARPQSLGTILMGPRGNAAKNIPTQP